MWACCESVPWLRSPEYAGAWCTFLLGVFSWVLATRGKDPARRLFRQARWVLIAELLVVLAVVEIGRWIHKGKGNPSDLYTMTSIALVVGWGVLLLLVVRFLRTRNEGGSRDPSPPAAWKPGRSRGESLRHGFGECEHDGRAVV